MESSLGSFFASEPVTIYCCPRCGVGFSTSPQSGELEDICHEGETYTIWRGKCEFPGCPTSELASMCTTGDVTDLVHRAAVLANEIYLAVEMATKDIRIPENVRFDNLSIAERDRILVRAHLDKSEFGEVYPIPEYLFAPEERVMMEYLLKWAECKRSVIVLHTVFRKLFGGFRFVQRVEEVYLDYRADTPDHCILRVTFRDNRRFVVDLTGSQCEQDELVLPWDVYETKIRKFLVSHRFGAGLDYAKVAAPKPGRVNERVLLGIAKVVESAIGVWEAASGMDLKTVLGLPSKRFGEAVASLQQGIANEMMKHVHLSLCEDGKTRLLFE